MRFSTLLLLTSAFLIAACSSGSGDEAVPTTATNPPSAEATRPAPTSSAATTGPTETPAPAATPTPGAPIPETATPSPDAPEAAASGINANNFATLDLAYDAVFDTPEYMAWQDDGRLLVASRDEASIIDPAGRTTEKAFTADEGEAIVSVSNAGQIAVSPDNRTIEIHDTSGAFVNTIQPEAEFGSISFSSDGSRMAVSRLDEIAVDIWNVADGSLAAEVKGFETSAPVYSAQFGPGDASIVWRSRATVQVTDLATGQMRPPMEHDLFVSSVFAPKGGTTLVSTWATFASLWNIDTGERIQNLDQGASAFQPAFVPGTDLVLVPTDEGVNGWNTTTFQEVATLDAPARQIEVSDDGRYLATLDQDGYLQVFAPPGPQ